MSIADSTSEISLSSSRMRAIVCFNSIDLAGIFEPSYFSRDNDDLRVLACLQILFSYDIMKMSGFEIFLRFERYNIGCEMEEKIVKTKILIVDDEHGIVDMIQSYFQKQYDILTAYSGQEALQKIASNPDLILLDINMPDIDGLTVCQKVRDYITCPILFLTARIESSDKIIGFHAGADDYIVKPFDLDELGARIAAHLRREQRRQSNSAVRFFGELALDYIDPADGLIHCKKCGGQRQTVVPCFGKPGYFMPRCICQCQREAEEQRRAAEERQRRMERIRRRKAQGLQDRYLYDYTFANDNGQNPLMDKARAYVENWKEAYKDNTGLLLFGDVGTGKSFFAGCIANALLDRDVPVLMTNFPTILNRLTGMFSEDRADFIASFDEYDLLIIDDLGVERSTEYAMEQMFFVIDSRYRSRRPMIITTNLKLAELKNPPDLAHARIYDRILERCAPILFAGKNFREENAGATKQAAKDIVNRKSD